MNKKELEKNLWQIIELYNNLQKNINSLLEWVNNEWKERKILDDFLGFLPFGGFGVNFFLLKFIIFPYYKY